METYWDIFNKKYGAKCLGKTLTTILEAFWYYCDGQEYKTIKILKKR